MQATTVCPCGKTHGSGAGILSCACGRRYIVVKNGDIGFTSSPVKTAAPPVSGFVVRDGKIERR